MTLLVEHLSKSYDGLEVLNDVSLRIGAGERLGIVGPNGAGKSTLFALISGFQSPNRGSIRFAGKRLDGMSSVARARLGLMRSFQVPRPFTHLTVRENLVAAAPEQSGERLYNLFLRPRRIGLEERRSFERADEILDRLRLAPVATRPASQISGGQLKLLELGRILMARPKFIMLDEPFAGVNPVLIDEISEHICRLNREGIGCLIIEHNLRALSDLVTRLIVLDRGRILAEGSPNEVLSDDRVRDAYVGSVA